MGRPKGMYGILNYLEWARKTPRLLGWFEEIERLVVE